MRKLCSRAEEPISEIADGATIMLNHLAGPGGVPQDLIQALASKGTRNLTLVILSNMGLTAGLGIKPGLQPWVRPSILIENKQVRKVILTWARAEAGGGMERQPLSEAMEKGEVEVELLPMGVMAHRIRAGGQGIGAFYSPVGLGTLYEEGKESRIINGKKYLLEYPLRAEFGFVRAHRGDALGNLTYRGTSRAINPLIAKACDFSIAEVDQIVEPGELDPNAIVTPGVFIDRIFQTTRSYYEG
ncbi:MAG: 3-oxoacid CoA-transferase subunit A [Chloroflexi bacterium]|nr:3-oxoacid CoA-transferase subunit A [Chloroflexota bacterium]